MTLTVTTPDRPASAGGSEPDPAADEPDQPPSAASGTAVQLDIRTTSAVARRAIDVRWLRDRLSAAAAHLPRHLAGLDLLIVDDAEMTRLHAQHGGEATTTDVLTFDLSASATAPIEADIVVCADVAARQAAAHGHDIAREVLLYTLHGLLHCSGYDDHSPAGYDAMHREEDRILAAIGVGRTFHVEPSRHDEARHDPDRDTEAKL